MVAKDPNSFPCWIEFQKSEIKDSASGILEKLKTKGLIELDLLNKHTIKELDNILESYVSENRCEADSFDSQLKREFELNSIYDKRINSFLNSPMGCARMKLGASKKCFETVFYFDLKAFKAFNDYLREDAGDVVLAFTSQYWLNMLAEKGFLIARKALGEEFHAYYMNEAQCIGVHEGYATSAAYGKRSKESKVTERVNECKANLPKQEICLFVPASIEQKRKLWHFRDGSDSPQLIKALEKNKNAILAEKDNLKNEFLFRIFLKGIEFRTGSGKGEKEAEKKAQEAKRNEESVRRGEFSKNVEIGIATNCDPHDPSKVEPIYHKANENVFLMIKSCETDLIDAVRNAMPDDRIVGDKEDSYYCIHSFVIAFNKTDDRGFGEDMEMQKALNEVGKSEALFRERAKLAKIVDDIWVKQPTVENDETNRRKMLLRQIARAVLNLDEYYDGEIDTFLDVKELLKKDELEEALKILAKGDLVKYDSSFSFLRDGIGLMLKGVLKPGELDKIYLISGDNMTSVVKAYGC